jgi:MFS family permease
VVQALPPFLGSVLCRSSFCLLVLCLVVLCLTDMVLWCVYCCLSSKSLEDLLIWLRSQVLWPSAILYIFAVMMTSLCTEYYQFILAQGVLGGIGMGMSMAPALAATGQYFQTKRAAALGIAVAGSSVGGVLFPIMLGKMLANESLGFGWTIRICGFVMIAVMLPSCLCVRARLPPRKGKLFLPKAFLELPYVTLILGSFMMLLGIFIPPFYLPTFAIGNGMSTELASYLVSIYNAASLFGRVIPGVLADRLGRFNVYIAAALSSAILGFCWQAVTTNPGVIVFAAVYGFCSGAIVSMTSVCLTLVPKDPKDIGTYLGMGLAASAIAALIGPPISGAILSRYGFDRVADFSGSVSVAGAIILVLAKWTTGKGLFSKF